MTIRLNLLRSYKNITYTNFDRMLLLQSSLQMAAGDFAEEPRRFNNILIVGPGLEQMNPKLREKVPRQSFEPFAVIDGLVQNELANVADINVDVVDINDRVVEYFDGIVQRAIESGYLPLYCTSEDKAGIERFGSGLAKEYVSDNEVRIPPEIVKRLKATGGNIITDHIAPDETYDMVVILNTFMYFTREEKIIALENIARLLAPGGVLITDVDRESISEHVPTCGKPLRSKLTSFDIPRLDFKLSTLRAYYKKE